MTFSLTSPAAPAARRLRALAAVLGAALLLVPRAHGQSPLEQALEAYDEGEYDEALRLLGAIRVDTTLETGQRARALHYLGRIYVAQNEMDRARQTLADLLRIEPPIFTPDPDEEALPFVRAYYDVRQEVSGGYGIEGADPARKTIAVIDFANQSLDDRARYDPLAWGFASMMAEQLTGATDLRVVERERLNWLMEEQNLQQDRRRVDQATAVRLGRLLGVQAVVLGRYTFDRRRLEIGVRVVDVETGEWLLTRQVEGRPDRYDEAMEGLSLQIIQALNGHLGAHTVAERTETRSMEALLSYAEGVDLEAKGQYREAAAKYEAALRHDSTYERARTKVASLRPYLAARG